VQRKNHTVLEVRTAAAAIRLTSLRLDRLHRIVQLLIYEQPSVILCCYANE
jgi:hypothetical protein